MAAALCVTGQPRGVSRLTLATILHNLVESLPWPADLYLLVNTNHSESVKREVDELSTWLKHASFFCSIRYCRFLRLADPNQRQLAQAIGSFKTNFSTWHDDNSSPLQLSMGKFGLLSWLLQLEATRSCWETIRRTERRTGKQYTAFVRTRLDSLWFSKFPLHERLRSSVIRRKRFAIVPSGNDFGGVNDRFIVADRTSFSVYASLHKDLQFGLGPWRVQGPEYAEGALRRQ